MTPDLSDQARFPKVRPAKRHSNIRPPKRQCRRPALGGGRIGVTALHLSAADQSPTGGAESPPPPDVGHCAQQTSTWRSPPACAGFSKSANLCWSGMETVRILPRQPSPRRDGPTPVSRGPTDVSPAHRLLPPTLGGEEEKRAPDRIRTCGLRLRRPPPSRNEPFAHPQIRSPTHRHNSRNRRRVSVPRMRQHQARGCC